MRVKPAVERIVSSNRVGLSRSEFALVKRHAKDSTQGKNPLRECEGVPPYWLLKNSPLTKREKCFRYPSETI